MRRTSGNPPEAAPSRCKRLLGRAVAAGPREAARSADQEAQALAQPGIVLDDGDADHGSGIPSTPDPRPGAGRRRERKRSSEGLRARAHVLEPAPFGLGDVPRRGVEARTVVGDLDGQLSGPRGGIRR